MTIDHQISVAAYELALAFGKPERIVQPDAQGDCTAYPASANSKVVPDRRIPQKAPALRQVLIELPGRHVLQFVAFVNYVFQKRAMSLHNYRR